MRAQRIRHMRIWLATLAADLLVLWFLFKWLMFYDIVIKLVLKVTFAESFVWMLLSVARSSWSSRRTEHMSTLGPRHCARIRILMWLRVNWSSIMTILCLRCFTEHLIHFSRILGHKRTFHVHHLVFRIKRHLTVSLDIVYSGWGRELLLERLIWRGCLLDL